MTNFDVKIEVEVTRKLQHAIRTSTLLDNLCWVPFAAFDWQATQPIRDGRLEPVLLQRLDYNQESDCLARVRLKSDASTSSFLNSS